MSPSGLAVMMVLTLTTPKTPTDAVVEVAPTASTPSVAVPIIDSTDPIILAAAVNQAAEPERQSLARASAMPHVYNQRTHLDLRLTRSFVDRMVDNLPRTVVDLR